MERICTILQWLSDENGKCFKILTLQYSWSNGCISAVVFGGKYLKGLKMFHENKDHF